MSKSNVTEYTPWSRSKPKRIGVYQRRMAIGPTLIRWAYWGGRSWFMSSKTRAGADHFFRIGWRSPNTTSPWRGLRRKP